tara:strand:- start:1111 stop:2100 length:990 start_codon:yes stop_codon:yes gene_type:complete
MSEQKKPKKRGRKSKKEKEALLKAQKEGLIDIPVKKNKKRGRKPKGGKIIEAKNLNTKEADKTNPNIILHLKCKTKDLNMFKNGNLLCQNNNIDIKSFDLNNKKLDYFELKDNKVKNDIEINIKEKEQKNYNDNKIIFEKIKKLKINLRHNNILYKRASCFWCTYPFDNPVIFIPKNRKKDTIEVYGCFCSPECACSYLKNEQLDDSTRWERYTMLNNLYCKIYNYEKNIKPAPSPFYTLDKYYGNLSIEEYRKLLKNERLLMVVDKPLTKILPELCEENNEFPNIFGNLLEKNNDNNNNNNNNKKYRLRSKNTTMSKKSILNNNFNFN